MKGLKKLNLSKNKISKIENLNGFKNLVELYLSFNLIGKIENIEDLYCLEILDLAFNKLKKIENLEKLNSLRFFYLEGNIIDNIEVNDGNLNVLSKLTGFSFSENILAKKINLKDVNNPRAFAAYFKERDAHKLIENKYCKLNILGEGGIGKTQLFKRLKGEKIFEKKHIKTHGMNVVNYNVPKTKYNSFIWDFGGQEYHHGTHAIFLRPQDLNIVLWRNDEKNVSTNTYNYWLGTARFFSKENDAYNPPLILLQNQWKEHDDKIAYPDSSKIEKYKVEPEAVFNIDLESVFKNDERATKKWNYFLEYFHEKIVHHAKSFDSIPKNFESVRKKLLETSFSDINLTKEEFIRKFSVRLKVEDNDFEYLLEWLDFSGCILYFSGIEAIKDFVFPNPPQFSKWIYEKVLTEDLLEINKGRFTIEDLKQNLESDASLDSKTIDAQIKSFMVLANHFKLLFKNPLNDKVEEYIVPQFLSDNSHTFKEVLLQLLPYTFCLKFPDFIHEGRFFQFMSDMGKFIKKEDAFWKYGILYNHPFEEGNKLKTIVYYSSNERKIIVHIENKKGRAQVAREIFDYFAFYEPVFKLNNSQSSSSNQNLVKRYPNLHEALKNNDFEHDKFIDLISDRETNNQRTEAHINSVDSLLSTDNETFIEVKEAINNVDNGQLYGICCYSKNRINLDFMAQNLLQTENKKKYRVFLSYSHKDEKYKLELDNHFSLTKRMGVIETWNDRKINAGQEWDKEIKHQLEQADVVLLLLSSDFFTSEYIWNEELKTIRERKEKDEKLEVIPIYVRSCDTSEFDMMKFQGGTVDEAGKPKWISSASDRDAVYTEIVKNVKKALGLESSKTEYAKLKS